MKLVVVTSDHYVDAVPLFFRALDKFWHDCPMKTELVYCEMPPVLSDKKPDSIVKLGMDQGWITNMIHYLKTPFGTEEPFLLMLEDYLICDVDRDVMKAAESAIAGPDVDMVRVRPTPGPTLPFSLPGIGQIDKNEPYSMSLQAAIWKPKALLRILEAVSAAGGKSPWDLEITGSKIVAKMDTGLFLGTEVTGVSAYNLYRRGKKVPDVVKWAKENLEV